MNLRQIASYATESHYITFLFESLSFTKLQDFALLESDFKQQSQKNFIQNLTYSLFLSSYQFSFLISL
jgi:hypothetical protein